MSDNTLRKTLVENGFEGMTIHGFRSTARQWAEVAGMPHRDAERALAHEVRGAVEAAYLRLDPVEQRAPWLETWAEFLEDGAMLTVGPNGPPSTPEAPTAPEVAVGGIVVRLF